MKEIKKKEGFIYYKFTEDFQKVLRLIKYLSQEGIKQLLQKTENFYMQDNNREMPKVDIDLYFVIDEKNNQIELTDKGIDTISNKNEESNFFILPDLSIELSEIENKNLELNKEVEEKKRFIMILLLKAKEFTH